MGLERSLAYDDLDQGDAVRRGTREATLLRSANASFCPVTESRCIRTRRETERGEDLSRC